VGEKDPRYSAATPALVSQVRLALGSFRPLCPPLLCCQPVPQGIRQRLGYRVAWDIMRRGIPCGVGYHAVRDTMQREIPCSVRYHAAWDTMPCGIPCNVEYGRGSVAEGGGYPAGLTLAHWRFRVWRTLPAAAVPTHAVQHAASCARPSVHVRAAEVCTSLARHRTLT
jgi:hypothetical protein